MSEDQKEKIRISILKIRDEISEARAKDWLFLSPKKEIVNIHNLNQFCKDNGLGIGHMSCVYHGKRPHHKGWTKCL